MAGQGLGDEPDENPARAKRPDEVDDARRWLDVHPAIDGTVRRAVRKELRDGARGVMGVENLLERAVPRRPRKRLELLDRGVDAYRLELPYEKSNAEGLGVSGHSVKVKQDAFDGGRTPHGCLSRRVAKTNTSIAGRMGPRHSCEGFSRQCTIP